MNLRYIYDDDYVLIIDDSKEVRKLEYTDNLDEILIKENLIEQIKNELNNLKNQNNKPIISFKLLIKCITILFSIPLFLIILPLIFNVVTFNAILLINYILVFSIPTIISIFLIYNYDQDKNRINIINNQKLFLEEKLKSETKELIILNKTNTKKINKNKKDTINIVDDIRVLQELKEQLLLIEGNITNSKKPKIYIKK